MNKKPNLLIIQTDQQSRWSLGCYEGTLVDTPNIDSIGREGVIFSNFFTPDAVCTPSRGCFITGRYPCHHGAYRNNLELNRDEITLAHILGNHGYDTGYAGKWHLDGDATPGWVKSDRAMGFQDSTYMFNRGHWKKIFEQEGGYPEVSKEVGDEKTYTTDWLTDKAIEFIRRDRKAPFFFMLSIPDPHFPFKVREPYCSMYNPNDMPVPSTFYEENRPGWINSKLDIRGQGWTEQQLREAMAIYCGMVKCIDDNVGKILNCLSEEGILDDTIVVFTTDHGEYLGEHGIYAKNQLYETAYRLPLLIRWPEGIDKGTVVNRFVTMVDFQQTILGIMGIEPSGREQGRDASPLVLGETIEWQDEAFIHHSDFRWTGIFTPQFELAYVRDGDHILFDRVNDPEQINNLFNDPKYQGIIKELTKRIVEHNRQFDTPVLGWLEKLIQE